MRFLKNRLIILTLVVPGLLLALPCLAQEAAEQVPAEKPVSPADEPSLTVTAVICTDIQDREPMGVRQTFPATVERLFCHTVVEGAEESDTITHVWYHGDQKMAEVQLAVDSSRWRTWSSKRIIQNWGGDWHVEILDRAGHVLATAPFQIQ
jgi:hypothetical protein